jgi:hypothetical protein
MAQEMGRLMDQPEAERRRIGHRQDVGVDVNVPTVVRWECAEVVSARRLIVGLVDNNRSQRQQCRRQIRRLVGRPEP